MRARGTIERVEPVRLVGAAESSRVATWDDEAVAEAFRACPWVEDELRSAGNRYQAEIGVTLGPLGERLDLALRASVLDRLELRALVEGEVFATRGKPIPGLLVVGAGELELLGEDDAPTPDTLRAGDFLFPTEVLHASPAPATVRAGKGGALILFAARHLAQELLVTCPPLLEIFAGG
jgi:CRP-like cAMP-binding protein